MGAGSSSANLMWPNTSIATAPYSTVQQRRNVSTAPTATGARAALQSRIVGVAEPELPDRLGGVDLPGRTAEEEAQQQPEMPAGPGVTGPA